MLQQPYCRYCGKPIGKRTHLIYFVRERLSHMKDSTWCAYIVGTPTTKAEAQRLVNQKIVSVRRGKDPYNPGSTAVSQVTVWDGESYASPFFCTDRHAVAFAYGVLNSETYSGLWHARLPHRHEEGDHR